jgi:hypothetical protein
MKPYRLYMRSFAPWPLFGGVIPGPTYENFGRLEYINNSNFHGDDRWFSLATDDSRVTSRINFSLDISPAEKKAGSPMVWCNESRGPILFLGPDDKRTAKPSATVIYFPDNQRGSLHVDVAFSAANPLVPGAPSISAQAALDLAFNPGTNPSSTSGFGLSPTLSIETTITGDQFPALECFLQDQGKQKIFLGGFAPESRSLGQLMRLFGQLNRPEIYFKSSVLITTSAEGVFDSISGSFGTQLRGSSQLVYPSSVKNWNAMIMGSIPKPSD